MPTLTEDQAATVRSLVSGAADAADSPALSEHALLHLRAAAPVRHLIAAAPEPAADPGSPQPAAAPPASGAALAGYAQLEDLPDGTTSIEIATGTSQPTAVAGTLLAAIAAGADRPLLVWAHGAASPVNAAAEQTGFRPVRSLLQLRRPLAGTDGPDLGDLSGPPGVTLRSFVPGADDAGWLAVNAAAFAHHPEQGGWTQADLADRLAADWFDPAGFLLAERDGELIGFHWTKVHPAASGPAGELTPAMGEVYVLGVAPAAQGLHLGSLLLRAGLAHLRGLGLTTVLLYVDESNTAAVRLYRNLGFETFTTDVQWALPASGPTVENPA